MPGDKSIAHRWLILSATAEGRSELRGLPGALDVRSTAKVLASLAPERASGPLEAWTTNAAATAEGERSTSNTPRPRAGGLVLESLGRASLRAPNGPLDCGNSGTTMRLLCGVLASCTFEARLVGDRSLSARPMERVAAPLRAMGADVATTDGRPPLRIRGRPLRGITHRPVAPSAQVKGAVLLAGTAAEGQTWVEESTPTRDHTERVLEHLGAPVHREGLRVGVEPFRHGGFSGTLPGDISSAAFLLAAGVITGRSVTVRRVGLNPTRTAFLDVLRRMGVRIEAEVEGQEVGEPIGTIVATATGSIAPTEVPETELPLVIDEVLVLAAVAAHAAGPTRFRGAGELRVKEIDRLVVTAEAFRGIGARTEVEGDDLVVAGGGVAGGRAASGGDHRLAMALAVAALGAVGPVEVEGMEAADVSFPGFVPILVSLGGALEA